jgi:hypothetical protein
LALTGANLSLAAAPGFVVKYIVEFFGIEFYAGVGGFLEVPSSPLF